MHTWRWEVFTLPQLMFLFLAIPAAIPSNAMPSTPTHDVNQLTDPRLHLLTFLAPPAQSRSVTIFSSILVTVVTLRNAFTLSFLTLFTTEGVFWLLTISGVSWGLHFLPHLFSLHCQCRHLELECLVVFIYYCVCVYVCTQKCRGQRTMCESQIAPLITMWILEIKLKSSVLAASIFVH